MAGFEIFDERRVGRFPVKELRRQSIITANAELRERELIKMEGLATALADALRRRNVTDSDARLAAEAGSAVFRVAFDRWVSDRKARDLSKVMRDVFGQLRMLAAAD